MHNFVLSTLRVASSVTDIQNKIKKNHDKKTKEDFGKIDDKEKNSVQGRHKFEYKETKSRRHQRERPN